MDLLLKVKDTIERFSLLEKNEKILVACSGGIDSMTLLDIMLKIKNEYNIDISVAHLNHMLRENAVSDELFVKSFCEERGIPVYIKRVEVGKLKIEKKLSEEEAGRIARYSFFEELKNEIGFDRLILGHNKNDVIETFFLNLFRGSGIDGLMSIPPKRGWISRPLIDTFRDEIQEYARKNNIAFVEDETNKTLKYKRNRVRNELLPYIENHFNPQISKTISSTIEILKQEQIYLNKIIEEKYKDILIFDLPFLIIDFKKIIYEDHFIKSFFIRKALKNFDIIPNLKNINDIIKLFYLQTGSKFIIEDMIIEKQVDGLVFYKKGLDINFNFTFEASENQNITLPNKEIILDVLQNKFPGYNLYVNIPKEIKTLSIRNRRDGDYINLEFGRKKIKDLFNDLKIPSRVKNRVPLLAIDSEVIAILEKINSKNGYIVNMKYLKNNECSSLIGIKVNDIKTSREEYML